eukprot:jgi/Hompol1/2328/HPOL_002907-RA
MELLRTATSIASEAGRISQMLTTQIVEKTKEVGLPAHLYETAEERTADIIPGLDSKVQTWVSVAACCCVATTAWLLPLLSVTRHQLLVSILSAADSAGFVCGQYDKEKLDALKRLIALTSKGKNVSEFFPHVIKNVASPSFEVRKLVYIYLLRYAEEQPDLALLSINTFQKDMADKNPLIRAMALRVMSSIRITLALKKGSTDLSPYVRKAAANAIPKCYSLDPTQKEYLIDLLQSLLNDKSTVVLGTAVSTLNHLCPDRLDLIHKHFHKLCRLLVDCDQWGQLEIIKMMVRYVRLNFTHPSADSDTASIASATTTYRTSTPATASAHSSARHIDPDHALFIKSCRPLLMNRNPAVVLAVVSAFSHIAPQRELRAAVPSLVRLIRNSYEILQSILVVILSVAKLVPSAFESHAQSFVVFEGDSDDVRNLKLEILAVIVSESNVDFILDEFKVELSALSFLSWFHISEAVIVGEAIIVLRQLLQSQSRTNTNSISASQQSSHTRLIRRLLENYNDITVPMAKASVLWLVGHHLPTLAKTAPDALRIAVKTFVDEPRIVKLQILNLAAAVAVEAVSTWVDGDQGRHVRLAIKACFSYAITMGKFDLDYDVRDRARFLKALVMDPLYGRDGEQGLSGAAASGIATPTSDGDGDSGGPTASGFLIKRLRQILAGSQGVSKPTDPYEGMSKYDMGTLSQAITTPVDGYEEVPPWATVASDAALRNSSNIGDESGSSSREQLPMTGFGSSSNGVGPEIVSYLAETYTFKPASAPRNAWLLWMNS